MYKRQGEDGYAPQISENGFWMVWDAETKKPVETKIKAATDIYVAADVYKRQVLREYRLHP